MADLQPNGIADTHSNITSNESSIDLDFPTFVRQRCRAYVLFGELPVETPAPGLKEFGCNCYSAGEQYYQEDIMCSAWRSMLDWFNVVHGTGEGYEEPDFRFIEEDVKKGNEVVWGEDESEGEFEGARVVEIS